MNTYRFVLKMPYPANRDVPDLRFYSESIQAESVTADHMRWLFNRLYTSQVDGGAYPECIQRLDADGKWVLV
ncbi:hypothetical protein [Rhodococcoides fascians]|uniref:hypothetical protein n=1 Tax=Rhodococcoides fascians TaxID=1828 RepID=UPI00050BF860|nr:hypothetical protein [Rhodococcus fascians]